MSVWTHVAAVFRIDSPKVGMDGPRINGYVKPDWDKVTKKAIYDGDWLTEDDYEGALICRMIREAEMKAGQALTNPVRTSPSPRRTT